MCRSTTLAESSAARSPPPQLDGFFFALVGPGDLLALPLRPLVSRCDRFRRPGKSSGPPPFAPSLNVQGNDTHNNSGFFGDLTPSIAKQLPKVVRMAMGTTVFRIRIELIFRRCCNMITSSRSCRGLFDAVGIYDALQSLTTMKPIIPLAARRTNPVYLFPLLTFSGWSAYAAKSVRQYRCRAPCLCRRYRA
jgi:hypothetical protein